MLADNFVDKKTIPLDDDQPFLSTKLLDILLKETDIPKEIAEEQNCELWYETYHGTGKAYFPTMTYTGNITCGILDSRVTIKEKDKNNGLTITTYETTSKIEFKDGTIYEGTIHNNVIEGEGKYTYPTGTIYEGQVHNGNKHGYGILYNTEQGVRYEGEWRDGLKEGKGTLIKPNMTYEGTFHNGVIDGKGKVKWKNGNYYDGEMHNNKIEGNGFMIWTEANEKYSGQWKNNVYDGFGVHICYEPKGEQKMIRNRYVGEWVNGKRHGFGVYFYANGIKYEGFWENDVKEGFGITHLLDRTLSIGEYKHDHLIEKFQRGATVTHSNKSVLNASATNQGKSIKGPSLFNQVDQNQNDNKTNTVISSEEMRVKQIIDREKEFKIHVDLSDLMLLDGSVKDSLKEIDKILLRNLSEIGHWYLFISGKESLKDLIDLGTSMGIDSKSTINMLSNMNSIIHHNNPITNVNPIPISNQNPNANPNQNTEEKKPMDMIQFETILNNDVSFCLELRELWKFLREFGLINCEMTLAEFDRILFQGPKNYYEMFYIPESIPNDKIHNYSFLMIAKAKYDFESKYLQPILKSKEDKNKYEALTHSTPERNIHNRRQIILLRHFYEVLIRLAYYKFYDSPLPLDVKVKTMIQTIKPLVRLKRKSTNTSKLIDNSTISTHSVLDIKVKNSDSLFQLFFLHNEIALITLFDSLFYLSRGNKNNENKTITYSFLYYKIIPKINKIKCLIPSKIAYCDLINRIHRNKKTINDEGCSIDKFALCNKLLNCDMIFYEFSELVFFIAKKYFIVYGKEKDEDYEEVIDLFNSGIKRHSKNLLKVDYHYPQLYAHTRLEELEKIRQDQLREAALKRLEKERYIKERNRLSIEDSNAFTLKEENSEDHSESDFY